MLLLGNEGLEWRLLILLLVWGRRDRSQAAEYLAADGRVGLGRLNTSRFQAWLLHQPTAVIADYDVPEDLITWPLSHILIRPHHHAMEWRLLLLLEVTQYLMLLHRRCRS